MPVTRCPHCRTELDLDAADFGYRVQCPSCQSAFTPEEPANPAPPPPPPRPQSDTADDDGTKVVSCPECNGKVGVLDADLGHDMRCPLCDKVFTATLGGLPPRATRRGDGDEPSWRGSRSGDRRRSRYDDEDEDEDDRPRRRRRSRYDDDSPDELIADAKRECSAAGVGLIIIACWGFLNGLFSLVLYGAILGGAVGNGGGFWAAFANVPEWQLWLNLGIGLLHLFTSAFLLYAGTQIRQGKQYGVCLIACVIAIVPGFSPCCLLGLIFGIMGLVKLNEPRVKRGFDANKPDYQGDGN